MRLSETIIGSTLMDITIATGTDANVKKKVDKTIKSHPCWEIAALDCYTKPKSTTAQVAVLLIQPQP